MKYKKSVIFIVITSLFIYFSLPIYQFYAHRYKVPMLVPWGDISIPEEAPQYSELHQRDLAQIAENAQALIGEHRKKINAPGLSIAVAIDQKLVWAAASGWSDIESEQAMTADTKLRIGSTSKALTSTGLARMVQSNHIALDTPLSAIFTSLPNPEWANITPRLLASHSAGMPHYKENTDRYGLLKSITLNTHYDNVDDAVSLFDDSELLSTPGEQFYYSSLGTVLLSSAMQNSVEQTYQQWMQQQVLSPLGMSNTMPEGQSTADKSSSTFYWQDRSEQKKVRVWRSVDLSHRLAGGGWLSTSKDLAKLGQGFLNDSFVEPSIRTEFWTPQVLNSGKVNPQNYGIGWRIHTLTLNNDEEVKYAHHGGVSRGAQSFLVVVPKYKLSLAVNINANTAEFQEFSRIVGDIIRLFLDSSIVSTQQNKSESE